MNNMITKLKIDIITSQKIAFRSTLRTTNSLSKPSLYTVSVRYTGGKKSIQEVSKAMSKTVINKVLPLEASSGSTVGHFNKGSSTTPMESPKFSTENAKKPDLIDKFLDPNKVNFLGQPIKSSSETPSLLDLVKAPLNPEVSLPKTSTNSLYERFYLKSGFNTMNQGNVSRPRLSTPEITQKHNMALDVAQKKHGKTLQVFCGQFANLPVEEIRKDKNILEYFNKLFYEHPELMQTRMGSLLWEVCYSKRNFDKKTLEDFLPEKKMTLGFFPGLQTTTDVDQSVVYNALNARAILSSDTPFNNIKYLEVVIVPPGGVPVKDLSPIGQEAVKHVKNATGNTYNDVIIEGHAYDFKNTKNPGIGKNHVFCYDQENLNKISRYFHDMKDYMEKETRNNKYSDMEIAYFKECVKVLEKVENSKISSIDEKFDIWNAHVVKTLEKRPPGCHFSLYYRTTTEPFKSDLESPETLTEELRRLHVESSHARQSVFSYVGENKNTMGHSAKEGTNGVIDVISKSEDE